MGEDMTSNVAPILTALQEIVITFELVTDEGENDPALINTVGGEVIHTLQQDGYISRAPIYTGQKGGFLVEFVTSIHQVAITIWNNHAAITEGVADLSGLVTVFGATLPVLKRMRQAHEKNIGNEESTAHSIKMTVEIDGAPLVIEASDITQADAALKLAQKYHSTYPTVATQVTTKSKVKAQGQVSARRRRRRR